MWIKKILCMLLIIGICREVSADIFLPKELTVLEEEVFSDCSSINEITFTKPDVIIREDALDHTGDSLWIHIPPGETAERLLKNGLDIDAETKCRALLIAQSYAGTNFALQGTVNDARAMYFCLASLQNQKYQIFQKTNLTVSSIKSAICTTFQDASEYDLSLFYYSGHGEVGGALVGKEGELLSAAELKDTLDQIPGRKIVILDSCFSGGILARSMNSTGEEIFKQYNQDVLEAFMKEDTVCEIQMLSEMADETPPEEGNGQESSEDTYKQYYIMTSAHAEELSEEGMITSGSTSRRMGYFSYFLCKGCGWDGVRNITTEKWADQNKDGVVSFGEAFDYVKSETKQYNEKQDAQSNMETCMNFSPFR